MFLSRILADCDRIIVTNKKLYKYTYRDDSALGKMKYEISEKKLANAVDIGIESTASSGPGICPFRPVSC